MDIVTKNGKTLRANDLKLQKHVLAPLSIGQNVYYTKVNPLMVVAGALPKEVREQQLESKSALKTVQGK